MTRVHYFQKTQWTYRHTSVTSSWVSDGRIKGWNIPVATVKRGSDLDYPWWMGQSEVSHVLRTGLLADMTSLSWLQADVSATGICLGPACRSHQLATTSLLNTQILSSQMQYIAQFQYPDQLRKIPSNLTTDWYATVQKVNIHMPLNTQILLF